MTKRYYKDRIGRIRDEQEWLAIYKSVLSIKELVNEEILKEVIIIDYSPLKPCNAEERYRIAQSKLEPYEDIKKDLKEKGIYEYSTLASFEDHKKYHETLKGMLGDAEYPEFKMKLDYPEPTLWQKIKHFFTKKLWMH